MVWVGARSGCHPSVPGGGGVGSVGRVHIRRICADRDRGKLGHARRDNFGGSQHGRYLCLRAKVAAGAGQFTRRCRSSRAASGVQQGSVGRDVENLLMGTASCMRRVGKIERERDCWHVRSCSPTRCCFRPRRQRRLDRRGARFRWKGRSRLALGIGGLDGSQEPHRKAHRGLLSDVLVGMT